MGKRQPNEAARRSAVRAGHAVEGVGRTTEQFKSGPRPRPQQPIHDGDVATRPSTLASTQPGVCSG